MVTSTGNAPEKKISSAFIYFFGSFGGILFGYDIGVMTGALPFLQNDWSLPASSVGLHRQLCLVQFLAVQWQDSFRTVSAAAR